MSDSTKREPTVALTIVRRGKPWRYSPWLADEIIARVAQGEGVVKICRDDHMPHHSSVFEWVDNIPEFAKRYFVAKRYYAEAMFESAMDVAFNVSDDVRLVFGNDGLPRAQINGFAIQRAKLIIDTMRYSLAKLYPRRFGEVGEKLSAEHEIEQEERAAEAERVKVSPIRPTMTREQWLGIHGLNSDKVYPTGK